MATHRDTDGCQATQNRTRGARSGLSLATFSGWQSYTQGSLRRLQPLDHFFT